MQIRISEEQAYECSKNIKAFGSMIVFELAEKAEEDKDYYLRNSIAKSITLLDSIKTLYEKEYINESWILYRSLVDRLVHIYHLEKENNYSAFKNFTFIQKFEHNSNARSDENNRHLLNNPSFQISRDKREKYNTIKQNGIKWTRPDAETVLSDNDLKFIYKYGYDYGSRFVHPMYDDGEREFYTLTGIEPNPHDDREDKILINNAILICVLAIQNALNACNFNFRKVVYDYIDSIVKFLKDCDDKNFKICFIKVSKLFSEGVELSK